ncbi:hypothetical protein ACLOJK_026937 [Asimina triloba]
MGVMERGSQACFHHAAHVPAVQWRRMAAGSWVDGCIRIIGSGGAGDGLGGELLQAWTSLAAGAAGRSGLGCSPSDGRKRATLPVIVRVSATSRHACCRALPSFSPSFLAAVHR